LATSVEPYRAIFEGSPDGIIVVNGDGKIRHTNPRAREILGYGPGELEGQPIERLVPEELRGVHTRHREGSSRHTDPRPMGVGMEFRTRRSDGSEFLAEIALSPVEDSGGNLVIATLRDVTQRKRLRDFGTGAMRASEDERARIARDLHDDTAQRLATALIGLRLLERSIGGDEALERIADLRAELQEAAEGIRRIARGLRPPELEDAGLAAALRAYARGLQETRGLEIGLDLDQVDPFLSPDGQLVIYRIVQEALTNVARHAQTTEATVRIWEEGERVRAEVVDQGCGFSPDEVGAGGGGLGLLGMQERAVMVGGMVRIDSTHGEGTRVIVSIPIEIEAEVERV